MFKDFVNSKKNIFFFITLKYVHNIFRIQCYSHKEITKEKDYDVR